MIFKLKRKGITKTLITVLLAVGIVACICVTVFGASPQRQGIVTTSPGYRLNVRSAPVDGAVIASLNSGDIVTVLGEKPVEGSVVWYLIDTGTVIGYVTSQYLEILPGETNASAEMRFTAPPSVSVGSNISIVVDVMGSGIGGYEANILYDTSYLHFVSASGSSGNFSHVNNSGVVRLVDYVSSGSTSKLSCTLTFKTKKTGTTNLTPSGCVFVSGTGDEIVPSQIGNSTVNIIPFPEELGATGFGVDITENLGAVVVGKPSADGSAMTVEALTEMINNENITITSTNGVVGTGSKISADGYELYIALKGDVDGDGMVTVFDAVMTQKALNDKLFTENDIREYAADIDGLNGTDERDVRAMLEHIVGNNSIA